MALANEGAALVAGSETVDILTYAFARLGTPISVLDIGDVGFESGVGARPHLMGQVECRPVDY